MNVLLLCLIVAVYGGWIGWTARGLAEARRDAGCLAAGREALRLAAEVDRETQA